LLLLLLLLLLRKLLHSTLQLLDGLLLLCQAVLLLLNQRGQVMYTALQLLHFISGNAAYLLVVQQPRGAVQL
jgi:hypothetical protein